jgi:hypothetical protein
MAKLFHAGIIATCCQVMAIFVLTTTMFLANPASDSVDSSLLTWSYVLVAAGMAFTSSRSVSETASRLHQVSSVARRGTSKGLLTTIVAQFGLATVLCTLLALFPPMNALLLASDLFRAGPLTPLVWSALMSVCVAGFGATAYAGAIAIRLGDRTN